MAMVIPVAVVGIGSIAISALYVILRELQAKDKKAFQELKITKDPIKYKKQKEQNFNDYLASLRPLPIKNEEINDEEKQKLNKVKNYAVMGTISAGKSTMLNTIFNLKLQIGLGHLTKSATDVTQLKNGQSQIHIWDCPGENPQEFSIYHKNVLQFIGTLDRIFILYSDSINSCKQLISAVLKLKPQCVYLVRTKCDHWKEDHKRTIEEEIKIDQQQVKKFNLGVVPPIYAFSSQKDSDFKDNQIVIDLLKGDK